MRNYKQLAARITLMVTAAALVASSAFADSRHQKETRDRVARRGQTRTERPSPSTSSQRSNGLRQPQRSTSQTTTRSSSTTNYERYRGNNSNNNSYHGTSSNSYHGNNNGYHGSSHSYGYAPHQSYYHSGRVTSYHAYHGGYRVYVAGAPYPFFVPYAYWDPFHFRIGFSINLGGYYNPAGYYDYYGYAPPPPYAGPATYAGPSHPAEVVTQAVIRGTVESVDYRGLTFVMRNESTGSFVTVDNSLRELHDVRPGDYVEVAGDWTRDLLYANNIAFLGANNNNEYQR